MLKFYVLRNSTKTIMSKSKIRASCKFTASDPVVKELVSGNSNSEKTDKPTMVTMAIIEYVRDESHAWLGAIENPDSSWTEDCVAHVKLRKFSWVVFEDRDVSEIPESRLALFKLLALASGDFQISDFDSDDWYVESKDAIRKYCTLLEMKVITDLESKIHRVRRRPDKKKIAIAKRDKVAKTLSAMRTCLDYTCENATVETELLGVLPSTAPQYIIKSLEELGYLKKSIKTWVKETQDNADQFEVGHEQPKSNSM